MPIINPDVSQMTDFEPSEPNTYLTTIIAVDPVKGKEKGTLGIQPSLEFEAPRLKDGEVRKIIRKPWHSIEGPGAFTFDQLLRCIGEDALADEIKKRPGQVGVDTDLFIGKQVNAIISTGIYKPKDGPERQQDEVKGYLPV